MVGLLQLRLARTVALEVASHSCLVGMVAYREGTQDRQEGTGDDQRTGLPCLPWEVHHIRGVGRLKTEVRTQNLRAEVLHPIHTRQ